MKLLVTPSELKGKVNVPSSKSVAIRAILCSAFSDFPTDITINGFSGDIMASLFAVKSLGGNFEILNNTVKIYPIVKDHSLKVVNVGESALTLRILLPLVCAFSLNVKFVGEGRIENRPIKELLSSLKGVTYSSCKVPLTISGTLLGGDYVVNGNISSQYITGLLFSLPLLKKNSNLKIEDKICSSSYIDMTIDVLRSFGIKIERKENEFFIKGNQKFISPKKFFVEGDYSSSAFFIGSNFLGDKIEVNGLQKDSFQGDKDIYLKLKDFETGKVDISDTPDLFPILSVCACFINKQICFSGTERLKFKESDRVKNMKYVLEKLGAKIRISRDTFTVYGKGKLKGGVTLKKIKDHRIIMAEIIASFKSDNPVTIKGCEFVDKSYPDFIEDCKALGGNINVI